MNETIDNNLIVRKYLNKCKKSIYFRNFIEFFRHFSDCNFMYAFSIKFRVAVLESGRRPMYFFGPVFIESFFK